MLIPKWLKSSIGKYSIEINGKTLTREYAEYITWQAQRIEILKLAKVDFGEQAISQLAKAKWNLLTQINIRAKDGKFKEGELQQLTAISFPKLKRINILINSLSAAECRILSGCNWQIEEISFEECSIDDAGCAQLAASKWKLTHLYLMNNKISVMGVRSIACCENWTALILVNLNRNQIGDKGCKIIKEAFWKQLRNLSLDSNEITAVGCKWLGKAWLRPLRSFSLKDNLLGWKGVKEMGGYVWPSLQTLQIKEQKIDVQAIRMLLNLAATQIKVIVVGEFMNDGVIRFFSRFMRMGHLNFRLFNQLT